ncbi:hypothetical protein M378DRAFT_155497, partial [Amanita muscaria Koide BX008]
MPDERTNSTITWLNSPVRGNQQSRSIINMIQVGQWYGKHVKDEPKVRTSTHIRCTPLTACIPGIASASSEVPC